MEDVVLHYRPGAAEDLSALLETTEKLLRPFPCRPTPVFRPWFPAGGRLPIRPAKPAPVISINNRSSLSFTHTNEDITGAPPEKRVRSSCHDSENQDPFFTGGAESNPLSYNKTSEHITCVPETQIDPPSEPFSRKPFVYVLPTEKHAEAPCVSHKRSWSIFAHKRVVHQTSKVLSKCFHHMVSKHSLHLRQRAKWIIRKSNCGKTQDIEKVWDILSRSVRSSELPTCNANIQRPLQEIWVYCDVLYSEPVGRFLKDHLQLVGKIKLCVHKMGIIYSL